MSDPLRTDTPRAADGVSEADRNAKIEELLLVGLDHYFASEYEQAINVWTRALFLDRSHARARAYIDRARSALAEHQRESEELLQAGVAAFNRGESDEARRLLHAAMKHGAPHDEALAVLDRLNRLEQGGPSQAPGHAVRGARSNFIPRAVGEPPASRLGLLLSIVAVVLVMGAGFIVAASTPIDWRSLLSLQPVPQPVPVVPAASDAPLPIPRRGETALARARALTAGGHLREALTALDLIRPTDAQKAEADRLRADIQRQLMALAGAAPPTGDVPSADPVADLPPQP